MGQGRQALPGAPAVARPAGSMAAVGNAAGEAPALPPLRSLPPSPLIQNGMLRVAPGSSGHCDVHCFAGLLRARFRSAKVWVPSVSGSGRGCVRLLWKGAKPSIKSDVCPEARPAPEEAVHAQRAVAVRCGGTRRRRWQEQVTALVNVCLHAASGKPLAPLALGVHLASAAAIPVFALHTQTSQCMRQSILPRHSGSGCNNSTLKVPSMFLAPSLQCTSPRGTSRHFRP